MARYICMNCGTIIIKSARSDPYMCRECERLLNGSESIERYTHLDDYQW